MKCPKCQHENPEDAIFCNGCGQKLELACPECGKVNPPGSRFCNGCGHDLTIPSEPPHKELSFDEKLDKIQRYLPKGLTEKVLSQRGKIEGERKQVTVMFCDMEGFTPLVEQVGAEEAYTVMDKVYEILIHKVHDYEGTVNEMTGDGIMALFGAPIALEDAPQRSIRSALAIHREMAKFSDTLKQEKKGLPHLKMRVGIHTGPVVVGTLGNDLRVEFKAVGDTVNLASRMEGLAEPGATYVSGDTFKSTEGLFRFEALGKKDIKGREDPVSVYRVIAPSSRRTRFDVSAERGLTPFMGRQRELELLLDGFDRVKQGRGQAFSIVSEAGVGKSRLLYEFRKEVLNEDVTFLEGKCLSYSRGVPYHPIIDIYKSNFDVQEGDEDFRIIEKVKSGLQGLGIDEASTLPYLLELLSVKDSGVDKIMMSPEAKRDRMMEAMRRVPLKGSEIRPLILAIEDLHWMDKSSEEVLKYLFESISGARILLIFTYRPEYVHTWGGRSYHNQLNLNRLSNRESLAMVAHLLGTEEIETDLGELILEKTEGVPFFIEEFIKSLKEMKVIEQRGDTYQLTKDATNMHIPSTIQDVIMARVDTLPEEARKVLQTGSVIEREFSYELLGELEKTPQEELLSHISVLKDSELIYERGIFPQSTYVFKHALTLDVVYDSLLASRKRELHENVGRAMEKVYAGNLGEHLASIAHHFAAGLNYEKGAKYYELAAKKAEKMNSMVDAVAHSEKRVDCIERLPQKEDTPRKLVEARTALAIYQVNINRHREAKDMVSPILETAKVLGDKKRLAQIYFVLGSYCYAIEDDHVNASRYYQEALSASEEAGDILSTVLANGWNGMALASNCEFKKAASYMERAIRINESTGTSWGVAAMKSHLSMMVHAQAGEIDLAFRTSQEAIDIAEKSGDSLSRAMAHISFGGACFHKGFFEDATQHLVLGTNLSLKANTSAWAQLGYRYLGDTYLELVEYTKAKNEFENCIRICQENGIFPAFSMSAEMGLAKCEAMTRQRSPDLELLYEHLGRNRVAYLGGSMRRSIAKILLDLDDGTHSLEAERHIIEAIHEDRTHGMQWYLGMNYALYAEFFKRKGDRSKAKENLNKALEILRECGADGWVEKYEKKLAALS